MFWKLPMLEDNPIMRWLWPLLAAMAGSVTSLSLRPYEKMNTVQILMALFCGAAFSVFVTPFVIHLIYGPTPSLNLPMLGALFYISSCAWNVLLPWIFRRIIALMGNGAKIEGEK